MAAADDPAATAASSSGPAPNRTPGSNRSKAVEAWAKETMETASACEIACLPEELISAAISRTAPRDACRAATVSPVFLSAADSCFLPRDLLPFAEGELHPVPQSKKALFMLDRLIGVYCLCRAFGWTGTAAPNATCCQRGRCASFGAICHDIGAVSLSPTQGPSPLCLAPLLSCEVKQYLIVVKRHWAAASTSNTTR